LIDIDPKLGLHRLDKPKISITDRLLGLKKTVESYQKRSLYTLLKGFEFFRGIKGNQYGGVKARAKLAFAYRGYTRQHFLQGLTTQ
jgi:hypothetical protein